jgi:glutaredoxin 3
MSPRIVMYTTRYCGYCERARRVLRARGIPYEDIDVTGNFELRRQMVKETGHRTVPIILLDGKLIGGSDELVAMNSTGQLDALARAS